MKLSDPHYLFTIIVVFVVLGGITALITLVSCKQKVCLKQIIL